MTPKRIRSFAPLARVAVNAAALDKNTRRVSSDIAPFSVEQCDADGHILHPELTLWSEIRPLSKSATLARYNFETVHAFGSRNLTFSIVANPNGIERRFRSKCLQLAHAFGSCARSNWFRSNSSMVTV
jgi:hypothetical protein